MTRLEEIMTEVVGISESEMCFNDGLNYHICVDDVKAICEKYGKELLKKAADETWVDIDWIDPYDFSCGWNEISVNKESILETEL
jgi:hypothetical protein